MRERRKINKLKVGICIFLIVLLLALSVFGRYIYNSAREAYFTARQFFFSSNILSVEGSEYQYDNWTGVDTYPIEIELYSYNNKLSRIDYDLQYTITCESLSEKISCSINTEDGGTSATGTIYATLNGTPNNVSRVAILVKPLAQINVGEEVKLKVTAKTEEPYQKEISCEFSLKMKLSGQTSYSIEDVANRDYALLKLVNPDESGAQVTLTFDPTKVRLDLNDETRLNDSDRDQAAVLGKDLRHADLLADDTFLHLILPPDHSLISISTPAGRSSFSIASKVARVGF